MKKLTILMFSLLIILTACGDSKQTISQTADKKVKLKKVQILKKKPMQN